MRLYPWRVLLLLGDAGLVTASAYLAFCLRLASCPLPPESNQVFLATIGPLVLFRLFSLSMHRVYRIACRHTSIRDLQVILLGMLFGTLMFTSYVIPFYGHHYPRGVLIIEWFTSTFFVVGLRIGCRITAEIRRSRVHRPAAGTRPRRVLILGAGALGASLAREIRRRPTRDVALVGFLDDDPDKRNLLLHGSPVLGPIADIRRVVAGRGVEEVIVAMPSAPGSRIREVIALCEELPVRLRISPGFSELNGNDGLRNLRDVSVDDLLRREPVRVDLDAVSAYLSGERVLVTGAGGSIGSELVRQIHSVGPEALLLLGHGENSIFEIEQELRREYNVHPTCLIADTRDYDRLLTLFERHRPTVVFHAAAHKHVPLMEANAAEAVTNNVLGTRNLARIAEITGVKRFVMISTDKAVNPTSVMGASKRVAEMVIQAESRRSNTEFAIVRFGNVLGSRGSVVPLMRKQIERGGPVTVTHPEVMRYFMTIPEAVQLVIQAGAMGGHGTIYILDMGEPVRIVDLARDLIRLSGLVPDKDVGIQFTGLRPGEKLFEELLTAQEGVTFTLHERIFIAPPTEFSVAALNRAVDELIATARSGDAQETRRRLRLLEPGFTGFAAPEPVAADRPPPARGHVPGEARKQGSLLQTG
jgi:FlaA1/EpsC-like NDP-sugar epimerase